MLFALVALTNSQLLELYRRMTSMRRMEMAADQVRALVSLCRVAADALAQLYKQVGCRDNHSSTELRTDLSPRK